MAGGLLLQHKHHGGLPADVRDLLQKGEVASNCVCMTGTIRRDWYQLCVHEVDQDHQEGLVSVVCVHEVDQDHQEGLVSVVCA